jgi:5'-nucleotidase
MKKAIKIVAAACLALMLAAPGFATGKYHHSKHDRDGYSQGLFWLTLLHNNDGESQLINAGSGLEDFGGAARFTTVVRKARLEAKFAHGHGHKKSMCQMGVITLSSGDNFLAGPEFSASLDKGVPYYDSILISLIGYDALALGNHEFDFGPDVLEDFIGGIWGNTRFLSANLDFSQEPGLQVLVDENRIAKSIVIRECGEQIGIVGATTEKLSFISSPRGVIVNDVAPAVQAEIDKLTRKGVNKIILISHLQSVSEDLTLLKQLYGVDIAIAGGGDELLANPKDLLLPSDNEEDIFGPYPLAGEDASGNFVPVVTTSGNYNYLGRLVVAFNKWGKIVEVNDKLSGPIRVAGGDNPDAVFPAPLVQMLVVEPIENALADLAATIVGTSEVALDGQRSQVRTAETNLGNLIADSQLWQASQLAAEFGAPMPDVAIQNGGGIRNDDTRDPGDITELDTFDIVPFSNFVCIVPNIAPQQFKEILENAVSRVEFIDGRFAQISGFKMVYDPAGQALVLDESGNVTQAGQRIKSIVLDNGSAIVEDGNIIAGAPSVNIATIDFLARGGDQYPYRGAPFFNLGVSYQQALRDYIQEGLGGTITAGDYPEGGEGRIFTMP